MSSEEEYGAPRCRVMAVGVEPMRNAEIGSRNSRTQTSTVCTRKISRRFLKESSGMDRKVSMHTLVYFLFSTVAGAFLSLSVSATPTHPPDGPPGIAGILAGIPSTPADRRGDGPPRPPSDQVALPAPVPVALPLKKTDVRLNMLFLCSRLRRRFHKQAPSRRGSRLTMPASF